MLSFTQSCRNSCTAELLERLCLRNGLVLYCRDQGMIQAMLRMEQRIDAGRLALHQPVSPVPCP